MYFQFLPTISLETHWGKLYFTKKALLVLTRHTFENRSRCETKTTDRKILFLKKWETCENQSHSLRDTCPYSELFWSVFFRIRTEYGEIFRIQSEYGKIRTRIIPNADMKLVWMYPGDDCSLFLFRFFNKNFWNIWNLERFMMHVFEIWRISN